MKPGDEGDDAWSVSLGFNIPIPNARRRAQLKEAELREEEQRHRRDAAEHRIREGVEGAIARLRSIESQLIVYEDSLIPLAGEAFQTSQALYRTGQSTYLDLLDAQHTMISTQRRFLAAQRDYMLALADLERVVGAPLDIAGDNA